MDVSCCSTVNDDIFTLRMCDEIGGGRLGRRFKYIVYFLDGCKKMCSPGEEISLVVYASRVVAESLRINVTICYDMHSVLEGFGCTGVACCNDAWCYRAVCLYSRFSTQSNEKLLRVV